MLNNLDANGEKRIYSRYISAANNACFKGTFADYKTAIQDKTGKAARASASYAAALRAGYKGSFEQFSKDLLGKR
jgi:hypothetical protein